MTSDEELLFTCICIVRQRFLLHTPSSHLLQINKKLMKDVTWNDSFERLSWRIDVRTLSKTVAEQNDEPIAFFEMATKNSTGPAAAVVHNAKFEMDRSEVTSMLASLNEIQQVFDGVQ